MQKTTKDLYKLLGLSRRASRDDVRKAHRKLVRKYHPDANPEDPQTEQRFKEIQQAYEVLSNPQKRREYDEGLHTSSRENTSKPRAKAGERIGGGINSTVDLSVLLDKLKDLFGNAHTGGFSVTDEDVPGRKLSGVTSKPREKRVKGPTAQGKRKSN